MLRAGLGDLGVLVLSGPPARRDLVRTPAVAEPPGSDVLVTDAGDTRNKKRIVIFVEPSPFSHVSGREGGMADSAHTQGFTPKVCGRSRGCGRHA